LTEALLITVVSAGSAGSVAAVITIPFDVVKTRIMLSATGDNVGPDAMKKVESAGAKGQSASSLPIEKGITRKSGLTVAREVMKRSRVRV
jgi:solute carrier family 25 (mitochondrial S-adenosylmethionine transporter), member 26